MDCVSNSVYIWCGMSAPRAVFYATGFQMRRALRLDEGGVSWSRANFTKPVGCASRGTSSGKLLGTPG
eukprot:15456014-Alexandrium_andersonii.AAC.1